MKNNNYDNFIRKPIGERNRETNITIPFTEDPECNEILTKELARCGFDINQCDGVLAVIKTKGNGNGYVGLTYDHERKVYKQAPKISQTEADKIFKTVAKKKSIFESADWEDMDSLENPFE